MLRHATAVTVGPHQHCTGRAATRAKLRAWRAKSARQGDGVDEVAGDTHRPTGFTLAFWHERLSNAEAYGSSLPMDDSITYRINSMSIKNLQSCAALAAAILCSGAQASSHIVDIAWSPEGRYKHQAHIAAGKFVEVCGKLAVGNSVRWSFTSAAPVDFNIHYHVGKEAVFPVKQAQVAMGDDTLKVAVAQDYCWMWTNKGSAPVSLTVELAR